VYLAGSCPITEIICWSPVLGSVLKKGNEKSIGRLRYKQNNETHSTRTKNDEKWRIMILHDMTDAIFNHLYRHCGHRGFFKKTTSIGGLFHWGHLKKPIRILVNCRQTFQQNKHLKKKNKLVSIDLFEPFPATKRRVKYAAVLLGALITSPISGT
jgi:hypothetical protein